MAILEVTRDKRGEIVYPDSDGMPVADNTLQFEWISTLKGGFDSLFADRPDVFVAGDLLWYPLEGRPDIRFAPDVLIAFGRPKGYRCSYMQWREGGVAPQVVWEVLSPGNTTAEMVRKWRFYDRYDVEEYYVYDPERVALSAWTRSGEELAEVLAPFGWTSPRTGVRFELEAGELAIYRPDGQRFLTYVELNQANKELSQMNEELSQAHKLAEQRATLAEAQAAEVQQQAAEVQQQAEQAQHQADAERQRAARFAAQLRAAGIDPEG